MKSNNFYCHSTKATETKNPVRPSSAVTRPSKVKVEELIQETKAMVEKKNAPNYATQVNKTLIAENKSLNKSNNLSKSHNKSTQRNSCYYSRSSRYIELSTQYMDKTVGRSRSKSYITLDTIYKNTHHVTTREENLTTTNENFNFKKIFEEYTRSLIPRTRPSMSVRMNPILLTKGNNYNNSEKPRKKHRIGSVLGPKEVQIIKQGNTSQKDTDEEIKLGQDAVVDNYKSVKLQRCQSALASKYGSKISNNEDILLSKSNELRDSMNRLYRDGIGKDKIKTLKNNYMLSQKLTGNENKKDNEIVFVDEITVPISKNHEIQQIKEIIDKNVKLLDGLRKTSYSKTIKTLQRDVNLSGQAPFRLLQTKYFSEKFRGINELVSIENDRDIKKKYDEIQKKKLVKILPVNSEALLNSFKNIKFNYLRTKKSYSLADWRKIIITAKNHLNRLNVNFFTFSEIFYYTGNVNFDSVSKLNLAVRSNEFEVCQQMVNEDKNILLYYDKSYQTPIHWAVKRKSLKILKLFLATGCFINSQDFLGRTPLHLAVVKEQWEIVRVLSNINTSCCCSKEPALF